MTARKLPVPSNQSDNPGDQKNTLGGRVLSVKLGDKTRRIGIDGPTDSIIKTIKLAFGLRTKRDFWLEDVDNIMRIIDRDMPVGSYTLHLDEGIMIEVRDRWPIIKLNCQGFKDSKDYEDYADKNHKKFYTEDDFCDFLSHQGWTCLREFDSHRKVDSIHGLSSGGIYYGSKK